MSRFNGIRTLSDGENEGIAEQLRQRVFDAAIQCAANTLVARDVALGRIKRNWQVDPSDGRSSRQTIESGGRRLDAVLTFPPEARAAILICHGIGETVQHWVGAQYMLAENRVASLVFDYGGYGQSSGTFHARQSELDASSAFHFLQQAVGPLPIFLLGFSLGSGIAASIMSKVRCNGLLLCSAFTSIRDAARCAGVPKALCGAVPPIWDVAEQLRRSNVPVLIVHGDRDRLFPVAMAERLHRHGGSRAQIAIIQGLGHNEAHYHPQKSCWDRIAAYVLELAGAGAPRPEVCE